MHVNTLFLKLLFFKSFLGFYIPIHFRFYIYMLIFIFLNLKMTLERSKRCSFLSLILITKYLPCSIDIVKNVLLFSVLRQILRKSMKKLSFPSFSKKCCVSIIVDSRLILS